MVDEEGMLIRGALYFPELAPGFSYREKLKEQSKSGAAAYLLKRLEEKLKILQGKYHFSAREIFLDKEKIRLLISKKNMLKNIRLFNKIGLLAALVTEYPTADQLEVEVEFLNAPGDLEGENRKK